MNARLLLLALLGSASFVSAQTLQVRTSDAVILKDKRITESSGLARSLRYPGVFWTHNDSGGEPCLFAINRQGQTLAKVRVPHAANFDWEDLTEGRDDQDRPCLFIGDIGDNLKFRASLQIYCVREPELPKDPDKEIESSEPEVWHLSYPDGRKNAECLMMHPLTRQLYLITKEESGHCALYQVPSKRGPGKGLTLIKICDLEFPARARKGKRPGMNSMTTSADFSPDGKRLVVATYSYLYEWTLSPKLPLEASLEQPPILIEPPLTKQMEAVCYDADAVTLWFTSEQLPAPLYRLSVK
ncbi:hypothetical protein SAMN02745166_01767 [Prosthecobacter debontii]|uniref:WD40-like Beta Propeller Repeat n=1 Tax=Prosthecobacter debontii TaxID=48467 RepID=A0A1T4XQ39_9BACT|nr:hypothetical protein [Prosthecobacter debontii]SKA91657.1 hypothetical protein SAMN02745166_01767 [Prosthecobacter debontii]